MTINKQKPVMIIGNNSPNVGKKAKCKQINTLINI